MLRALVLVAASLGAGCLLQNMNTETRLRDSVAELNDQLRWSRVSVAAELVEPSYRDAFLAAHRHWGRGVIVADLEVTAMRVVGSGEAARSTVELSWYRPSQMVLERSILEQRWRLHDGGFVLVEEAVVEGSGGLLAESDPASVVDPTSADPSELDLDATSDEGGA